MMTSNLTPDQNFDADFPENEDDDNEANGNNDDDDRDRRRCPSMSPHIPPVGDLNLFFLTLKSFVSSPLLFQRTDPLIEHLRARLKII